MFAEETRSQYSPVQGPKTSQPMKPVEAHAKMLHDMASTLMQANSRLEAALDRLAGMAAPVPASGGKDQPEPAGALLIAAFGAERIRQQIEYLGTQVLRLEDLA